MPALSLCMMVRNEERRLQACLNSIVTIVREIVIVDTGSTDQTVAIAHRNGAIVLPFDFNYVDFAAARNCGLNHATGDWIFVLDADETLETASHAEIAAILSANENAGFYVERRNGSTVDHAVRLFPNRPEFRYHGRVHETVDASILAAGAPLRKSAIRIQHDFAPDPESRRRRNLRYIAILNEEFEANPNDSTRLDFLAAEYHQLEMFNEAAEVAELIVLARPLDPMAHLNAGIYHLVYQSDPARARVDFLRALELRPGYPEALSFLKTIDGNQEAAGNCSPASQ